jgi:hypothetical protein
MSHCIFMSRLRYCLDVAVQVAVKHKTRVALDRTLPRGVTKVHGHGAGVRQLQDAGK